MDYFGYHKLAKELYELKFVSDGSSDLSQQVVTAFKDAGFTARTTPKTEPRGKDERGFDGPGLDHGVFVPFRLMFGHEFHQVPIVQASIDSTLSPEGNWAVGKAVQKLRYESYTRTVSAHASDFCIEKRESSSSLVGLPFIRWKTSQRSSSLPRSQSSKSSTKLCSIQSQRVP